MKKAVTTISLCLILALIINPQIFEKSENISKSTNASKWGGVAFGPDGLAHVCWEEDYIGFAGADIMYAYHNGTKWTKTTITTDKGIDKKYPDIAVGKNGTIAVVWEQKEGTSHYIYMREYSPTQKKWLPVEKVSGLYWGNFPAVAVDSEGNIFVAFYAEHGGDAFSRSKINGKWEDVVNHSKPFFTRSTQIDITCGNDDTVWIVFRLKLEFGNTKEYKIFYTYRKHNSNWIRGTRANYGGASQGRPFLAVNNQNQPVIYYQDKASALGEIWTITIDKKENSREKLMPLALTHFPCGIFNSEGIQYMAYQEGAYEWGSGIIYKYRDYPNGNWSTVQKVPSSGAGPTIAKMSADDFGNVAIVFDAQSSFNEKDIFFSSIMPVEARGVKPPQNLTWNIKIENIGSSMQVIYNLNWTENPDNNPDLLKGYLLYRKELDGEYTLFEELNKDVLSRQVVVKNDFKKYLFAVSAISNSDYESDKVEFVPTSEEEE